LTRLARPPAWAAAVFGLALCARLGFALLVDQPLLYAHQYTYFTSALRIAAHPSPLRYLLASDEWRVWDEHWTIAPLYFPFAAACFRVLGPHLLPLRLLQCVLDSLVAVGVAALGRRVAGPKGAWAGAVYALHWPAVEMTSWTMTENLHTVLLVWGVTLLAREPPQETRRSVLWGGFLLGLSALARSVTSAFVLGLALLRALGDRTRSGLLAAGLVVGGAALPIVPFLVRNVAIGHPPSIETAAYENLWWANQLGDRERFARQRELVYSQPTPERVRAAALGFALKNIRENPGRLPEKLRANFFHLLRPDWLDSLLRVERPGAVWQQIAGILTEDLLLVAVVPPFLAFLIAAPPSPTRRLIALWTAYYLTMIVVVFHNELRYRSALTPFVLAGAAGGVALLGRAGRAPRQAWLATAAGLLLSAAMVADYPGRALRTLRALSALSVADAPLARGDLAEAKRIAEAAAALDPRSPRAWLAYGRRLHAAGHAAEALDAYRRAQAVAKPGTVIPTLVLPRLLAETGDRDAWLKAVEAADLYSWNNDPWVALETAWRELPPPRTDIIEVGHGDYGAARGFLHPRGLEPRLLRRYRTFEVYERDTDDAIPPGFHRWSRSRAWLRLVPLTSADAYDVTIEMGSPLPSPLAAPEVEVRTAGSVQRFKLSRGIAPYTLRVAAPRTGPLLVEIRAPTWCRAGHPAEQGVRVDRLSVAPASP
jgi:tetratricopeptide (TPR) repeat protein